MSRARRVALAALVGFLAGSVMLGLGGRLAMRAVAYTEPAPPRFTWLGTLQVVAAGAVWGGLTGPVLLAFDSVRARWRWITGLAFGAVVLGLAALVVALAVGRGGQVVAPPAFIILSAVLFPILFLVHGMVVDVLVTRWGGLDGRAQ